MSKSLYNIGQNYLEIIDQLEEGELTPELEKALEITQSELNQKSIAYLEVIKKKESFNDLIDSEIKRLQAIKKSNDSVVSRLKNNLLNAVLFFGEYTIGTVSFKTRKSERIDIINEKLIPNNFKIIKQIIIVDKISIKKALKAGEKIEGAELKENQNLAIK